MLSAMIVHKAAVADLVERCRRFSKPVIAGGPLFSTGRAAFPNIQHFVLGEAEDIMPQLIEDLRAGTLRPTYAAPDRPDITRSPVPRWDPLTLSIMLPWRCSFRGAARSIASSAIFPS